MKYLLLSLTIFTIAFSNSFGEKPTKDSVIDLIEAMNLSDVIYGIQNQMDASFGGMLSEAFKRENLSTEEKAVVMEIAKSLSAQYKKELSWENLKVSYIQIYTDIYTQEEVDAQLVFYESELGQSVVSKNSILTEKSMIAMQEKVAPIMQNLHKSIQEAIAKAKEKQR